MPAITPLPTTGVDGQKRADIRSRSQSAWSPLEDKSIDNTTVTQLDALHARMNDSDTAQPGRARQPLTRRGEPCLYGAARSAELEAGCRSGKGFGKFGPAAARRPSREAPMGGVPMDPYEVLGVDRGATPEQVKSAFRTIAQIYHPDRYQNASGAVREEAARRMADATAARDQLLAGRPMTSPPPSNSNISEPLVFLDRATGAQSATRLDQVAAHCETHVRHGRDLEFFVCGPNPRPTGGRWHRGSIFRDETDPLDWMAQFIWAPDGGGGWSVALRLEDSGFTSPDQVPPPFQGHLELGVGMIYCEAPRATTIEQVTALVGAVSAAVQRIHGAVTIVG